MYYFVSFKNQKTLFGEKEFGHFYTFSRRVFVKISNEGRKQFAFLGELEHLT